MNPRKIIPLELAKRPKQKRFGKAQGLVEFALVLPILLLLVFGLIELARIFQAWLAVTNAARFGMRYGVTGEYNPGFCTDLNGNGLTCAQEPVREFRNAEEDAARLLSIKEVARSVAIGPVIDDTAVKGEPGYFHITVCSSRPGFYYNPPPDDTCVPREDPGNPEEGPMRVLVSVTYQHPLILPFISNIWPSVTLHAERSGILEQFRIARVLGLPPIISVPTPTPGPSATFTDTPVPSETPLATETLLPSHTPTPTETGTPTTSPTVTNTPTPSCENLSLGYLYFKKQNIRWPMSNEGAFEITVDKIESSWNGAWHDEVDYLPYPSGVYFDGYSWDDTQFYNEYPYQELVPGWSYTTRDNGVNLVMTAGNSGELGMHFRQSITDYYSYYHSKDFTVRLTYTVGEDLVCTQFVPTRYGPVVIPNMPSNPITGSFTVSADAYDPDPGGSIYQVHFEIRNSANQVVYSHDENISPYCINGDDGRNCYSIDIPGNWPGSSNPITNGTYTLLIQARDNDRANPPQQYTQVKREFTINIQPTATATITPTPCPANGTGLRGDYYDNPDFTSLQLVRLDPTVNFNWGFNSPSPAIGVDDFSVRWTGYVLPMYSGNYSFYLNIDDGGRLWVNNNLIIDAWRDQTLTEYSGNITLQGCQKYDIRIEYYDRSGGAVAQLSWSSAEQAKQIIPMPNLYPPQGTPPPTQPPPTPTRTPTRTNTLPPSKTPTITQTPTRTPKPSNTPTPTATVPSRTPTNTATQPPATVTFTPTITVNTPTFTITPTPAPATPTKTATPCPFGGFDC